MCLFSDTEELTVLNLQFLMCPLEGAVGLSMSFYTTESETPHFFSLVDFPPFFFALRRLMTSSDLSPFCRPQTQRSEPSTSKRSGRWGRRTSGCRGSSRGRWSAGRPCADNCLRANPAWRWTMRGRGTRGESDRLLHESAPLNLLSSPPDTSTRCPRRACEPELCPAPSPTPPPPAPAGPSHPVGAFMAEVDGPPVWLMSGAELRAADKVAETRSVTVLLITTVRAARY